MKWLGVWVLMLVGWLFLASAQSQKCKKLGWSDAEALREGRKLLFGLTVISALAMLGLYLIFGAGQP